VSPVKIQKKFGSINYVPSKKTSNAGYIHQKPAAQTNTSIQGQEELNPSSIGSFLSKHWWALATKKKNKKKHHHLSMSATILLLNYFLQLIDPPGHTLSPHT
jgi:hypothetical protein